MNYPPKMLTTREKEKEKNTGAIKLDLIEDIEIIDKIILERTPLGSYWFIDKDAPKPYIGIDNTNGDAWVEEFKTKRAVLKWLLG